MLKFGYKETKFTKESDNINLSIIDSGQEETHYYSYFKVSTGFTFVVLMSWKLIAIKAIIVIIKAESKNASQPRLIR